MFNTSFENSKRALFREQKEDKHPTDLILINFSSLQLFNFDKALASISHTTFSPGVTSIRAVVGGRAAIKHQR